MGTVFNDARHSSWFDGYVDLVLWCEGGLCSRHFGGTRCHHLLGNFDTEDVDSMLLQNFGISVHFHAVPTFDKKSFLWIILLLRAGSTAINFRPFKISLSCSVLHASCFVHCVLLLLLFNIRTCSEILFVLVWDD